jgi:hypothetical protein
MSTHLPWYIQLQFTISAAGSGAEQSATTGDSSLDQRARTRAKFMPARRSLFARPHTLQPHAPMGARVVATSVKRVWYGVWRSRESEWRDSAKWCLGHVLTILKQR